jgi:glycosidase
VRTELRSLPLARLAAVLLFTSPGIPLVYYGDEVGMEGGPDPDCRRCMEWDPDRQDTTTRELYRRLIRLRQRYPWLTDGDWETVRAEAGQRLLIFRRTRRGVQDASLRETEPESLYVMINAGQTKFTYALSTPVAGIWRDAFTETTVVKQIGLSGRVGPRGYAVLHWQASE